MEGPQLPGRGHLPPGPDAVAEAEAGPRHHRDALRPEEGGRGVRGTGHLLGQLHGAQGVRDIPGGESELQINVSQDLKFYDFH